MTNRNPFSTRATKFCGAIVLLAVLMILALQWHRTTNEFDAPRGAEPKSVFAPCSEIHLSGFESQAGITLPKEYRDFLLKRNGTILDDVVVNARDSSDELIPIWVLYGIDPNSAGGSYDLRSEQFGYEFKERVPQGIITIGQSVSGSHAVCMSTRAHDYGAVYYWNPGLDWEEEENVRTERYLTRLAGGFREFWRLLRHRKPEDREVITKVEIRRVE